MTGGDATRVGDVLTMRNGKTVEVLNTDAEGRLVLADGLSIASEAEPDAIVDPGHAHRRHRGGARLEGGRDVLGSTTTPGSIQVRDGRLSRSRRSGCGSCP